MNKNLILLYISKLISSLGDQVYVIALSVTLYKISGSALITTGIIIIKALVHFINLFFYKSIENMKYQKYIVVCGDIIRCLLIILLIPLIHWSYLSVYLIVLILEIIQIYCSSARIILLNNIEGVKNRSNITDQIIQTIAMGIGLAIGGIITYEINYKAALLLNASSFIISSLIFCFFKSPSNVKADKDKDKKHVPLLKWFFNQKEKVIKQFVIVLPFYSFAAVPFNSLLVIFVIDYLEKDARVYGYLEALMAVGLFIGGILSYRIQYNKYIVFINLSILLMGISYYILVNSSSLFLISSLLMLSSIANMVYFTIHRTTLSLLFKGTDIGNAWTLYKAINTILGALGTFIFSIFADAFSTVLTMKISSMILMLFGLYLIFILKKDYLSPYLKNIK